MGHLGNALSAITSFVPSWLLGSTEPLPTVGKVELPRYQGRWYEIATIPMFAQRDCTATTASYRLLDDGEIEVVNRCIDTHGTEQMIEGRAWVPDPKEPGKLKVRFYWPMRADYYIVALGDQYEYVVVGHPSRRHLWIMGRSPYMAPDLYQRLLDRACSLGYDLSRLRRTPQPS